MGMVQGICPSCKKQSEVNTSESVDFCKLCGKSYSVKDSIDLYKKHAEKSEASREPSKEVMDKFNAILEQDYKLAEQYLADYIKKEYSYESAKLLAFTTKNIKLDTGWSMREDDSQVYYYDQGYSMPSASLKQMAEINPAIADMHYKILCRHVNSLYNNEYNGGLAELKLFLGNGTGQLSNIKRYIDASNDYDYSKEKRGNSQEKAIKEWANTSRFIEEQKQRQGIEEYDDEYICYVIREIRKWSSKLAEDKDGNLVRRYSGGYTTRGEALVSFWILNGRSGKGPDSLTVLLEKFLSPSKRREAEVERFAEDARLANKRKEDAYKQGLSFWEEYVRILKEGTAQAALLFLQREKEKRSSLQTDEFEKFKNGLFRIKYTGDINTLSAEELAKKALEKK